MDLLSATARTAKHEQFPLVKRRQTITCWKAAALTRLQEERSYDGPSFARNWSERSRSERAPASSPAAARASPRAL